MQSQWTVGTGSSTLLLPQRSASSVTARIFLHRTAAVHGKQRPRTRLRVQADARGVLDTLVTYGAVSLSLGATAYTVFHDRRRATASRSEKPAVAALPEDNSTWAVMGVVSCIPLFNSMAWVLGALQSGDPRPYYWAAALYTLPLLRNGFDQDWFSVSLLLLGVAHVQALRIAATEPETQAQLQQQLKPLAVLQTVVDAAGTAVNTSIGTGSSKQQQQQAGPGNASNNTAGALGDQHQVDPEEYLRQRELEEFDKRLNTRSSDRRL